MLEKALKASAPPCAAIAEATSSAPRARLDLGDRDVENRHRPEVFERPVPALGRTDHREGEVLRLHIALGDLAHLLRSDS